MRLADVFAPLIDLVYPPRCPLCGDGVQTQTGLCSACWETLVLPSQPACPSCGRPFTRAIAPNAICAPCLADPPKHDGIAAATLYNTTSRKLILALKHGNSLGLVPMLAGLMHAKVPWLDGDWLVIPVPLHRWRLWQRGFNQSAVLARSIARGSGAQLLVDGLQRTRHTPSLGGLGKAQRARVLSGAIALNPRHRDLVKGHQVLLVDDVYTSGATAAACVSVLKRAGVRTVVVSCFARVLDEALNET